MKKQNSFAVLVLIILFSSCKKNDSPGATQLPAGVYVAGIQQDSVTGYDKSAVWKDGTLSINALNSNKNHYAYAIAASATDLYTTGYENTDNGWKCQVWKNGQHQYALGDGYSMGSGIALMGNDVYVSGYAYQPSPVNRFAMLWKNNNSTANVLAVSANYAEASAVAISGTDVYVAGKENDDVKIWKNGVALTLNNATGCTITSIAAEGNDVYAAGYTNTPLRVRYWKNGISTDIATTGSAYANAITVVNGDVYVAGNDISGPKSVAKYWKNGVLTILGDGIRSSHANGIAIKGADVYVAGDIQGANNLSDYAAVWKNGQATIIGFQNSRAKAILVK